MSRPPSFIPGVKDHKGQVRAMADKKDGCVGGGDKGEEVGPRKVLRRTPDRLRPCPPA